MAFAVRIRPILAETRTRGSTMMPVGAGRVAVLLALVIFVCTAGRAGAQLYEWVDEKGQHNFTDNPNNIPEKYRPKASVSPGLQASPETIRRDADRKRQEAEELERAREAREALERQQAEQRAAQQQRSGHSQTPGRSVEQADDAEARQRFLDVARRCAWEISATGPKIVPRPDGSVTTFGSERARFAFEKCMTQSGQPVHWRQ